MNAHAARTMAAGNPVLLGRLVDDLGASLGSHIDADTYCVLLWLDPEQQFYRHAQHVEVPLQHRGIHFLRLALDEGFGQVALKLALLRLEGQPDGRAVVYLPGFDRQALEPRADGGVPTLWSVYEYRYKGAVWGLGEAREVGAVPEPPTLLDWLQSQGVQVATEKARRDLGKGGADALIGRYAERQRTTAPAEWPRPLRLSDVEALLGGDPRDGSGVAMPARSYLDAAMAVHHTQLTAL